MRQEDFDDEDDTDESFLREVTPKGHRDGLVAASNALPRLMLDPTKTEMLIQVGTMVVEHEQYLDAWDWLVDVLQESGTGLEATAGLLYGVSGVGKSTILRLFVKKYGQPMPTAKGLVRAVVRVSTPPNPTLANVYKAMTRAMGAVEALSNDLDDLRTVVLTQLVEQDVQMVIFDEFTHIVEDRSEKFATRVVRALKELLSEKMCQCVFAGTEELVNVHSIYRQFRRRSAGDMPLFPFDWDNDDDRDEWIQMMDKIQAALPIKCSTPLGDPAMAKKMHLATDGIMDHVMKLLFRATSFAYDDGEEMISDASLVIAFERLRRGDRKRVNPFGKPTRRGRGIRIVHQPVGTEPPAADEATNLRASGQPPPPSFAK